nr:AAA family ATPase [Geomonas sp. Red32]
MAGFSALESRGAAESCFLLVAGKAGNGKTSTARWWGLNTNINAVYVRATASINSHWILAEIVRELGQHPDRRMEYCFAQALKEVAKARRPLIIDEAEHCLEDPRVLESVRDISDLTEVPVILVGYDQIRAKLKKYEQLSSRVSAVVDFKPLTLEDTRTCCKELCEVVIADDLVAAIHRDSAGRIRLVKEGIASCERHAKRNSRPEVSLDDMRGQILIHDWTKAPKGGR